MILIDAEAKVDLLNNEAIALTIIKTLRYRPDQAVTFGVHGDWGAGKSSILEMIQATLEDDKAVVCLKFNGWRFQGFEDAKIALIEGIVLELLRARTWGTEIRKKGVALLKRIDYLKVARRGGQALWNMTTGLPSPGQLDAVTSGLQRVANDSGQVVTRENVEKVVKSVGGFVKPAQDKRIPQEIEEFREAFAGLLKDAGVEQLVVLVDDLDRCLPETAIQTLEAIRLFVSSERTVFVVGADEAMIEYAVRRHFPDVPDTTLPRDYARNYLEKLIQVPFRLPALGEAETRIYVALLLLGAEIGEDAPEFSKLIDSARVQLRKPWAAKALDAGALRAAVGDKATPRMQELLTISDQIGPMLARKFIGNPRQIKRFLNALLLRMSIAEARGFDVSLPVLAKLMVAERFLPALFEQIAASSSIAADGRCAELAEFERRRGVELDDTDAEADTDAESDTDTEAEPARKGRVRPKPKDQSVQAEATLLALAWSGSADIRAWSALSPETLGGVDLRPYLFIAKDQRDFFAGSSALARLGELIAALRGGRLAVQRATERILALGATDATAVFDELRIVILGAPDRLFASGWSQCPVAHVG
jgi:predicted KAP-like P-loop ATPase